MWQSATPVSRFFLWNVRMYLLALLVLLPVSSGAQIQLRCHQDRPYHPTDPKTQQPQFNDVDVLVPVSSSAPDIATGKRARVGGGTDGGIEISAQGREGDATITYQVKDRSTGAVTTVQVRVHVQCPTPPPPPDHPKQPHNPPPNRPPVTDPRTPTHRQTNCKDCKAKAAELNAAIDELSKAQAQGNSTRIAELQEKVRKLSEELDKCEKECREKEEKGGRTGG